MKRGGLTLAVLLFVGGLLRVTVPGSSASPEQSGLSPSLPSLPETPKAEPKDAYLRDLEAQIQDSYGAWGDSTAKTADLTAHLSVPDEYDNLAQRAQVQFVIAILPDPVHTHLALFFDRSIEAIQQAAQRKGYFFERAIMPWARTPPTEFGDFESRRLETDQRKNREQYPGLLIFREGASLREQHTPPGSGTIQALPRQPNYGIPLFVLVVGETPTGGLNKAQFRNALKLMNTVRAGAEAKRSTPKGPALILGPSFSGSLVSLSQTLHDPDAQSALGETYVYSGTVTDKESEDTFVQQLSSLGHFLSFQENDAYLMAQFVKFATGQGYELDEIAVLSEGDTAYGNQRGLRDSKMSRVFAQLKSSKKPAQQAPPVQTAGSEEIENGGLVFLHFPREISYFRSAYQKEIDGQQSGAAGAPRSTLTLDLGQTGSNGDVVSPYAAAVTPASQEAVMLGIVGELHKHQIAFALLFATDPIDELFLARYLRSAYRGGRVVVTSPDLLFPREGDNVLHGVLGFNTYPLVAGLDDQLCRLVDSNVRHEDRLFVSNLSVGTYNAMLGLLSVPGSPPGDKVPDAFYEGYGAPLPQNPVNANSCAMSPRIWLTMLGRDGFWPIAQFSAQDLESSQPRASADSAAGTVKLPESTLKPFEEQPSLKDIQKSIEENVHHTPTAWNLAYCLCLFLMAFHFVLSWAGSILADSESRAQFARSKDWRHTIMVALGALSLCTGFVVLMGARNPVLNWDVSPSWILTAVLWVPLFLFTGLTIWDLAKLRGQRWVAGAFASTLFVATALLLLAAFDRLPGSPPHWPTRIVAVASGASPILPSLLLLAAGYWWMWQSLRGVTLVDLRRPRLPEKSDLPPEVYHIDDDLAEQVRIAAHPFLFERRIDLPVIGVLLVALLFLDLDHPVQTVEGIAYDLAYSSLLGLIIATLLGVLLKLVWSWFKCRQILAGLDRLPLREAFSRMKGLSWYSMWNPGGSTLRETYKVMSRALESLGRLELVLKENDPKAPFSGDDKNKVLKEIQETVKSRTKVRDVYEEIVHGDSSKPRPKDADLRVPDSSGALGRFLRSGGRRMREAAHMPDLMEGVEALQKQLAKTAAVIMSCILKALWGNERSPVVSEQEKAKQELPLSRVLAEEYTALIYVNFLITVLLRMRTLVVCAAGLFVFIVLSVNVYPFEPHPALQTLCVLLFVAAGVAVGFVYAEMHREAILSRLTSTNIGELGIDFWLKFVSAGAVPLLSLLAAQFPGINQFLFSWLEPALQALK